jgi:hypothetical protein
MAHGQLGAPDRSIQRGRKIDPGQRLAFEKIRLATCNAAPLICIQGYPTIASSKIPRRYYDLINVAGIVISGAGD